MIKRPWVELAADWIATLEKMSISSVNKASSFESVTMSDILLASKRVLAEISKLNFAESGNRTRYALQRCKYVSQTIYTTYCYR